jgi:hypothetical protein
MNYMTEIISDAQKRRYSVDGPERKSEGVVITSKWMEELTKYPYFSSKHLSLISYRETWDGHLSHEGEVKSEEAVTASQRVQAAKTPL